MSWRILVADDSALLRSMMRKALAISGLEGVELLEATNGREALELLGTSRFDLVLADINMPEMSGLELVDRMKADPALAAIRVVVVSSERNSMRIEALRLRGVGYLGKPFRPEELRDVLRGVGVGGAHA